MISLRFLVFLIFLILVRHMLCLYLFSNDLILFSSWVSNGVVGSPAFAAFDKGLLYLH